MFEHQVKCGRPVTYSTTTCSALSTLYAGANIAQTDIGLPITSDGNHRHRAAGGCYCRIQGHPLQPL